MVIKTTNYANQKYRFKIVFMHLTRCFYEKNVIKSDTKNLLKLFINTGQERIDLMANYAATH